jgi:hypothetical protein
MRIRVWSVEKKIGVFSSPVCQRRNPGERESISGSDLDPSSGDEHGRNTMLVVVADIVCPRDTGIMNSSFLALKMIESIQRAARLGFLAALILCLSDGLSATAAPAELNRLNPPAKDQIPVASLISDGAVVIDFTGPWEVFQDVNVPSRQDAPFAIEGE